MKWGLTDYNGRDEVCSECLCNRDDMPFTRMDGGAEWRPTEQMTKLAYVQRIRRPLHPLAALALCTRWFFFLDIMHLMDCKGVAALLFGSILCWLILLPVVGPNKAARSVAITQKRLSYYSRFPLLHKLSPIKKRAI